MDNLRKVDLVWISDPGHAWLRVPLSDYVSSGITASRYSYVDAEYVYLEEDRDAELYLDAARIPNSPLPFPTETFREIYFADVGARGNPRHLDRISEGKWHCVYCNSGYSQFEEYVQHKMRHGYTRDQIGGSTNE